MKFQVIQTEYVYLKLKPNNSIKNTQTHLIARTISNMYKSIWESFIKEEEKLFTVFNRDIPVPTSVSLKRQGKISYFVYMEHQKVEFYFIIPKHFYSVMKERISGVWNGITVEEVKELPQFNADAYKYQMVYEKEDGLSLMTNRTDNDLLNASLNTIELLEDGDKAGILYNFIPVSQNAFKYKYQSTIDKMKNGQPIERNKVGMKYILLLGVSFIDGLIKNIAEVLAGKSVKQEESVLEGIIEKLNGGKKISESTTKKIKGQIIDTQILIFSESKDRVRIKERSYATSLVQGFDVLSGDNRLVGEQYRGNVNIAATRIPNVKVNQMWDEEAQSFIALPGRELLERYPFISKVETQELELPKDLQTGTKCIGTVTYRGNQQKAFLTEDKEFRNLMLLLIGPNRAGKSNLITHLCIDSITNGECVIIFDFIKKCELSTDVAKHFPKDKVLEIACDDYEKMQGIGYNEVGYSDDPFKQYDNAKRQTTNTLTLINAVNNSGDSSRLTPKMERYLESACLAVYISGGSVKDVISVLKDHVIRHEFIDKIPKKQRGNLEDYVNNLRELDERSRDGKEIVGTKYQAGIFDRINTLKRNTYMELMLKKDLSNNVNLVEEMQKNQLIVIKMPQAMFTTSEEKDIFTTYWMTKIWLALQIRSDKIEDKDIMPVNLIIDELYQVNHTEQFLTSYLSQIAKFRMKPIISAHYINQLTHIREELKNANPSVMLLAGSNKRNYDELKNELYPFEYEDLQNLQRYHSLNYIKTKDGYSSFITKMPGDVKNRKVT